MSTHAYTIPILTVCIAGLAATAAAQTPAIGQPPALAQSQTGAFQTTSTPTWETSAGYQVLFVPDETFPFGLNVDGARNFGPLGIAAELGWAYRSQDDEGISLWNFGAGPRWSGSRSGRLWPFAQVIAGGLHARGFGDSETHFMLQPGAGLGVLYGDGWGLFGQVDYRRVFLDEDIDGESGENEFRIYFGVRVILD
jgi:hypothetical protein